MPPPTIEELLTEHRETIVRWGDEMERIGERGAPRRANKLFVRMHAQFKVLRESHEGRVGITTMIRDSNYYVASHCAAHSLLWEPGRAIEALEALQGSTEAPPTVRISAGVTLQEWRAGNLNLDW